MADVEYRLLMVESGAVYGDRTVIGLVHSDGQRLRFQFHPDRLPPRWVHARDAILGAVRTFERRLAELPREEAQLSLGARLDDVFYVRDGAGSALAWSPIRHASPTHADAHFHALVQEYELTPEDEAASMRVSAEELREGLRSLGERLQTKYPTRVRVGAPSDGELSFNAPMSWKNGKWHQAIAVSLDYRKPHEVARRMLEVSGSALIGVPEDQIPVLVAVMPESPEARVQADNGSRAITKRRGDVQIVEASRDAEHRFDALAERIERDLSEPH